MALSQNQTDKIKTLLSSKIKKKLASYDRETTSMPFLARLIQDSEKIAAYSFIHSLATTLGMSIYEDVSVILASEHSDFCSRKYGVGGAISDAQRNVINKIISDLKEEKRTANIKFEKEEVLKASWENSRSQSLGNIADFYMRKGNQEFFFEIKTVKPNMDVFKASKTKLLEWVARRQKPVNVFLALPYNPCHPEPYERFAELRLMEPRKDFLVGDEYWDYLGGQGTFPELLQVFDEVGKEFKERLNKKFKELAKNKIDSY